MIELLELPQSVPEYLRTHDSPELATVFTEHRLRGLGILKDLRSRIFWHKLGSGPAIQLQKQAAQPLRCMV